jgi:glucose-6-phosphate 1-dehydrogenase
MEAPSSFAPEAIRAESAKLLHAVRSLDPAEVVRGQYGAGFIDGVPDPAYSEEPGVGRESTTETYVAMRVHIDNWRWAGVPVYLRTGKRLPVTGAEVDIAFHESPIEYFATAEGPQRHSNHLTLHIQPGENISFRFLTKVPGPEVIAKPVRLEYRYDDAFMVAPAEAYERLIHDAMNGDQTLFVREDALEEAWRIVDPILEAPPTVHPYEAGSWGPDAADELIAPERWHLRG